MPGSLAHRISPLDDTFDNLTVAGDWTDCGFNEGCVEAAVMSGRLAAHAISKLPPLETSPDTTIREPETSPMPIDST